jgi:UDP-N-acetylglucosamine--N-acetylmuramyl-(pentapeptide) pyrophosphoryl-undecaprenol N-acetylglucosamine transferase
MPQPSKKIIISGGGTGGHIFPAIAIADALKARLGEAEIRFIGAKGRMEMEKVPAAGYPIDGLWISGLQRKLTLKNLSFPFKLISSIMKARRIIKSFQPDVAIGTGGYASGPMLRVASKKGVPSLIQEQNSFPGITNRILGKTVDSICVAYEGMEKYFPASRITITGNPVRKEILHIDGKENEATSFFKLDNHLKTMLIIGGSQGARSVNLAISSLLNKIMEEEIQLIWQCGKAYAGEAENIVRALPEEKRKRVQVHAFISRMDLAYAAADLIISRAGAIAISEICLAGKPALLVPLPIAAEDHQTKNALALQDKDAGILIPDDKQQEKLLPAISDLLNDDARRKTMGENLRRLALPDATEKIVDEIVKLLEK